MIKRGAIAFMAVLAATSAMADPPQQPTVGGGTPTVTASTPPPKFTIEMTQADIQQWSQVVRTLDLCVGSVSMVNDPGPCKTLREFLTTYTAKVEAAGPH